MDKLKQYALMRLAAYRAAEKTDCHVFDHYLSVFESDGVVTSRYHIQKDPALRHAYDCDGLCVHFSHAGGEIAMEIEKTKTPSMYRKPKVKNKGGGDD